MTRENIIARINRIMVDGFEVEPEALHPGARLGDDLGLDSMDAVDLVVAIEKEFACRIREAEARGMRQMKDLYDHIERWRAGATQVMSS